MPRVVFGKSGVNRGAWRFLYTLCASALLSAAPRVAWAKKPPITAKSLQVDVGVRYGLELEPGKFNPWRTGYGGAVGYTLKNGFYLGGSFDYYVGQAGPRPAPIVSGNYWQLLAQFGYDVRLSKRWIMRPKVGVGSATLSFEGCDYYVGNEITCLKTRSTDTAIVPGIQLTFVTSVTVTVEARYAMIFNGVEIKDALIGGLGVGF